MLSIVEKDCEFHPTYEDGEVVVESDLTDFPLAIEELTDPEATKIAMAYAANRGVTPVRLNGFRNAPFPVNGEGLPLDQVRGPDGQPLAHDHPRMRVARYRAVVPVRKGFV